MSRTGPRGWRRPLLAGAACAAGIVALVLWAPDSVRGWTAGVRTAGLAGYLSTELALVVRKALAPRVPGQIVVTAQVFSAVYVVEGYQATREKRPPRFRSAQS